MQTEMTDINPNPALANLCGQAADCLAQAFDLPAGQLKGKVDQAENIVVRLRNGLIARLRDEQAQGPPGSSRWRNPLDQVNLSLSLIAGVAYPGSKIHRNYVEDAHQVLMDVRKELPE